MNIIAKLDSRPAYIVEDAGTRYPIFEESLHAKEIFDNLISSGYKFCALPYEFKKDGVSISTLPVMKYDITADVEQDMFDFNDLERYSATELRQKISEDDIQYIQEPPAAYRISTREEFLKYLEDCQTVSMEEDFYPINYFVHPNARFTIDEWMSGEYTEYFNIMEARRRLSYQKFLNLRNWLIDMGMNPVGSAIDIVDMYCMWGLDGINARFVSKQRKTSLVYDSFVMQSGMRADAYEISKNEIALVDRYGAIFPPEDVTAGYDGWHVAYTRGSESSAFRNLTSTIKEGEFGIVPVTTKSEEEILEFSTMKETITVSPYMARCGKASTYMFVVMMPDVTAKNLPAYLWSAKYDQRVLEMSNLRALAYEIIKKRKHTTDASSFKMLTNNGCDAKGAFRYILSKNSMPEVMTEEETEDVVPTEGDIELFCSGNYDEDELSDAQTQAFDVLKDIQNGIYNTGSIAAGEKSDAAFNVEEIYKYLYCAHFCLTNISIDSMYKLIMEGLESNIVSHTNALGYVEEVLPLVSGGYVINVPCPVIRGKIDGYKVDIRQYDVKQSEQCCGFLKITQIASEYGDNQPRHVAFEAKTVNLYADNNKAQKYLTMLMEIYEQQLVENVPLNRHATLRAYKRLICMREYFRVAETGCMAFTAEMGGKTVPVPFDVAVAIGSTIKTKITSTAVYCAKMVDQEGLLTHYCVNADITPWKIYPKKGYTIPCASLPSLWYDWYGMGQSEIAIELAKAGYTYVGFLPWTTRYIEQRYFKDLTGLPAEADLSKYMQYCEQFRSATKNTEEFIHAPHLESLFYGMFPDETVRNDNGTELRAAGTVPSVRVSVGRIETYDSDHWNVNIIDTKDKALRKFTGFTAEDFNMIGDIRKVKLPSFTEKSIVVNGDTISVDEREDLPIYMISQLGANFPVINLWGRKYIFRDIMGALWEVIV